MQFDEPAHIRDELLVEAQGPQPLRRKLRTDDVVVMEGHDSPALGALRRGLADVVHQRRHPQHEIGGEPMLPRLLELDHLVEHRETVLVDVLVVVVLVDLEPQGGQLRQHDRGDAGLDEEFEADAGVGSAQELRELVSDAFR